MISFISDTESKLIVHVWQNNWGLESLASKPAHAYITRGSMLFEVITKY